VAFGVAREVVAVTAKEAAVAEAPGSSAAAAVELGNRLEPVDPDTALEFEA